MNRITRIFLVALLGFLIAGWSIWQYQEARIVSGWAALYSASPEQLLTARATGQLPDRVPALLALSAVYSDRVFPPDNQRALDVLRLAANRDPLNSVIWYRIAKNNTRMGRTELARGALERSDRLDPYFPNHRLASIQLWSVLDEPQRALKVARELGRLGGMYRLSAARELTAIGLPPSDVFDALDLETADAYEQVRVMQVIGPDSPEELRILFSRLDWNGLASAESLNLALKVASKPFLYDIAARIWHLTVDDLIETSDFIIHNPRLADSPFEEDFGLGWQRFPDQPGLEYRWLSPEGLDENLLGRIVVSFPPRQKDVKLNWILYRFLLAPGAGAEVSLKLRQRTAARIQAGIQVRVNGRTVGNSKVRPPDYAWSSFPVRCEPVEEGGIVEVRLVATPIAANLSEINTLELEIGGIEVEAASLTMEAKR